MGADENPGLRGVDEARLGVQPAADRAGCRPGTPDHQAESPRPQMQQPLPVKGDRTDAAPNGSQPPPSGTKGTASRRGRQENASPPGGLSAVFPDLREESGPPPDAIEHLAEVASVELGAAHLVTERIEVVHEMSGEAHVHSRVLVWSRGGNAEVDQIVEVGRHQMPVVLTVNLPAQIAVLLVPHDRHADPDEVAVPAAVDQ